MNLVLSTTGIRVVTEWSSILEPDTKVIVATLSVDVPYYKAPWLCVDATCIQRQYEVKSALFRFGISDVTFLDYPSLKELEFDRILAHLQVLVLLFRVKNVYCGNNNVLLSLVCNSLQGVSKVITTVDNVDFMNKQKEEALLEFKEIL